MDGSANDFTFKHILNVLITATDETLGVEDGVVGVHGDLVLRRVTNQTLSVCEIVSMLSRLKAGQMEGNLPVKATNEGVVRLPWSLAMISMRSSRKTPTHE